MRWSGNSQGRKSLTHSLCLRYFGLLICPFSTRDVPERMVLNQPAAPGSDHGKPHISQLLGKVSNSWPVLLHQGHRHSTVQVPAPLCAWQGSPGARAALVRFSEAAAAGEAQAQPRPLDIQSWGSALVHPLELSRAALARSLNIPSWECLCPLARIPKLASCLCHLYCTPPQFTGVAHSDASVSNSHLNWVDFQSSCPVTRQAPCKYGIAFYLLFSEFEGVALQRNLLSAYVWCAEVWTPIVFIVCSMIGRVFLRGIAPRVM